MVRTLEEIESGLKSAEPSAVNDTLTTEAKPKVRSLEQIQSDSQVFAGGIDKTLMDERIQQFVSTDLDEDSKYKLANSLYLSTAFKQPFEDVYDNYDGIMENLHINKKPKDFFDEIHWKSMDEKQRFATYDKSTSFWKKAKDYYERTGVRMVKSLSGLIEADTDIGLKIQKKLTGGKTSPITAKLNEWSRNMRLGVQEHMKENPRMYVNPAGDGFWGTTNAYLDNPEYILFGVAEQVPYLLASLVSGGTAGVVAKGVGAGAKAVKTAQWVGRVEGFAVPLFGERYSDLRSEGIVPEAAFAEAFLAAQSEALLEEWTMMFNVGLFKGAGFTAKKGISRYAAKWLLDKPWYVKTGAFTASTYLTGASEEGLQAISDNFWAMTFRDVDTDLLEGVGQQAAVGGLLELFMGTGFKSAGKVFYPHSVSQEVQLARLDKFREIINESPVSVERKQELNAVLDNVESDITEGKWTEPKKKPTAEVKTDETGMPESVESEPEADPVKNTERYGVQEIGGKWVVKDWETQQEISVHDKSRRALGEAIALNKGDIEARKYKSPLPPSDLLKPITIRQALNYVMKGMQKASRAAYLQAAKDIVGTIKDLNKYAQKLLKNVPIKESERNRLMNYIAASQTPSQKANALAIIQKISDDAVKRQAVSELKRVVAYVNKAANEKMYNKGLRPEYFEKIQAIIEGFTTKKISENTKNRIKSLADYLDNVKIQAQSKYEIAFIESQIPKGLINKIRSLETKHIDSMDTNEILSITDTLRQLIHMNNLKTELIMKRRAEGVAQMLDSAIEEAENLKQRPVTESADFSAKRHKDNLFAKVANFFVGNKNHDIETLAETISGGHHTTAHKVLSENLSQGREKEAGFLNRWDEAQRKAFKENGIDIETLQEFSDTFFQTIKNPAIRKKLGLKRAKRYSVTIGGKAVDMTMAELMSLYMHAQHLEFNLPEMLKSGVASKEGPIGKIGFKEIENISDIVEANPKAVALCNMARELFEMSGNSINEVSMLLDGIELAKVIGYWPVRRYSSGGVAGRQEYRISLLETQSFLQEREGSNRPMVIRDFFEVLTASQQGIAEYYGLAIPLRTIKNLLNYRPLRDVLINQKGYGEELRLIDVMIERLEQKPHPYSETDKYVRMMLSGLTRSVLANPGVMAGQYASVMGYFTEADIKYMSALRLAPDKATTAKYKKIWNLYKRRAEGGISSVAIYDAMQSDVLLQAYTDKKSYPNYLTQGIHYVDILAITEAGRITEAEMKDENLSGKSLEYWSLEGIDPATLKDGTQEWNDAFVKRANYLMRRTQPMFFTENRSVLTSAETTLEKTLYLFRSYVDQPLRMFYRAVNDYRNGKISQKSLVGQYGTVISGLAFYEVVRFALDKILFDTDDDEIDLILRMLTSPIRIMNLIGYPAGETVKSLLTSAIKDEPMKWSLPDISPLPLQFANDIIKGGYKITRGLSYAGTNERFQSGPRKGKLKSEEYIIEGVGDVTLLGLKLIGVPVSFLSKFAKEKDKADKIKI